MTINASIFDLRFLSNIEIQPTAEELADFLRSSKNGPRSELQGSDLAKYHMTIDDIRAFECSLPRRVQPHALHDRMYFGVLSHTRLFTPSLRSAVEQYKFLFHALATLDFRKPASFIKAAEEEIDRLRGNKPEAAARRARLQGMIDERKDQLQRLQRRRAALVSELGNIALYIRHNLIKIVRLCENSVQVLDSRSRLLGSERQQIENSIAGALDQMRASYGLEPISIRHRQTNARDVAALALKVTSLIEGDIRALRDLYTAIHRYVETMARTIDALTGKSIDRRSKCIEEDLDLFAQTEHVLVTLISDYHFELKRDDARTVTGQSDILLEKRWDMTDHIFALLNQDRRISVNRRVRRERRTSPDRYQGPERRERRARRVPANRRSEYHAWL
jgi:hypothetical protein